jgi:hypothetical protein
MDAVWGADPKTTAEVEKDIDVPYPAADIVEASGQRLGPGMKALAPWLGRMAIVNSVRQNSANHPSGLVHTVCCKSSSTSGMPTLLDILGSRRRDEAVGSVSLGATFATAYSPKYLGQPGTYQFGDKPGLFDHLDKADPDDLVTLAKALERKGHATRHGSESEAATSANVLDSSRFLARYAGSPRFATSEWPHKWESYYGNAKDLQRVLWMFEHGLTRCATVFVCNQEFDTHLWNFWQPVLIDYLSTLLAHVFAELDHRVVDGQALSEQTVVVVGSEIGRFPRINAARGKDHLPQAPYLFYGPWFATGNTFGGTDREMVSLPISLGTGRPERGGHLPVVDDVGTTLLRLDGANPEAYGYTGQNLAFLSP